MILKLVEKREETSDVKSFIWETETKIVWKPGQFMEYLLEHNSPDNRGTKRWFTISSAPCESKLMLTTRITSKRSSFKDKLNDMLIGDSIQAEGPKGKFNIEDMEPYYVLIAGGIGITPYRSMLVQFKNDNQKLKGILIYQNKDENFLFREIIDEYIASNPDFRALYQLSNITPDNILDEIPAGKRPIFYLSGPEGMVESYNQMLLNMGFIEEQIKKDEFPGYDWPLA